MTEWRYFGEDLRSISKEDKEMLANLKKTGKFTNRELNEFRKVLVSREYDSEKLKRASALHEKDSSKSIPEWYDSL